MTKIFAFILLFLLFTDQIVFSQRGPKRDRGPEFEKIFQETGLKPGFPDNFLCPAITSAFGSRTDGAGNLRDTFIHSGTHGGVDINLKIGQSLIAISNGEIIFKGPKEGTGTQMEGIFVWLRHSPLDTGLPFWTFSKYQHLKELPILNSGDRVKAGQIFSLGGDTGTYSKKFGGSLPHLHISTFIKENSDFDILPNNQIRLPGSYHVDTMVLFIKDITLNKIKDETYFEKVEKKIPVDVADSNGLYSKSDAKIFWPVACNRK